ncbi:MAG: GNAT family N-acetyltransferase [Clostridioides sp.]|jgi:ribosomal-protein-alanine N-acetyltransferase|nr:GNAT family N-acetyltransferase [Clostridioides sp.]
MENKSINRILLENQVLETKRLILRKIKMEDANDMYEYSGDEETVKYVSFKKHKDLNETYEVLANVFFTNYLRNYAIEIKDTGKMIGTIGLNELDENSAEIGWIINKKFWGNGYAPESGNRILKLLFEELNVNQVHAYYDVRNIKSGKALSKLGMNKWGTIYSYVKAKGEDEKIIENKTNSTSNNQNKENNIQNKEDASKQKVIGNKKQVVGIDVNYVGITKEQYFICNID